MVVLRDTLTLIQEDHSPPSVLSNQRDPNSYDHILSVTLKELGKSHYLVQGVPKLHSIWVMETEVQVHSSSKSFAWICRRSNQNLQKTCSLVVSL